MSSWAVGKQPSEETEKIRNRENRENRGKNENGKQATSEAMQRNRLRSQGCEQMVQNESGRRNRAGLGNRITGIVI